MLDPADYAIFNNEMSRTHVNSLGGLPVKQSRVVCASLEELRCIVQF